MSALFGKTTDGKVRSGKIPITQQLQIPKGDTTNDPEIVGPGRNGVTYNVGSDGRVLVDCLVHVVSLPDSGGPGQLRDRAIFVRADETTPRTGAKNACIQGGFNQAGRVIFSIADDLVKLSDSDSGDVDGAIPDLINGGNNFTWNYYRPSISEDNLIGSFFGDGSDQFGNPGDGIGNEHQIWCVTPTGVIEAGKTYHIAFMTSGTRMYIAVNGVILGDFKAPAGGTIFRTNGVRFINTNWFLGRHPNGSGTTAGILPEVWFYGFRIWTRDITPNKLGFLRNFPYQSQSIIGSGADESRVVSSFAFENDQGTIDNQDYGEAANTITLSDPVADIIVNENRLLDPITPATLAMGHGPS